MKFILALAIAFLFSFSSTAFAAEYIPTISVNGEGNIETAPDRATISIGVVSRDKDATKVQAENARIANEIIRAVTSLGVERRNIRTGNYSFQQKYRYEGENNRRRIFDGYEVNNTVTIVVDDLNLIGKVIDASLSHGANSINNLAFGVRDKSALQEEALRLAVADAKQKAEIIAAGLGKVIVAVKNVTFNSGSVHAPQMARMAMAMEDSANFETPIEGGTLNCTVSVHVDFEISR